MQREYLLFKEDVYIIEHRYQYVKYVPLLDKPCD